MCNIRYKFYVLKICKWNVNWGFILVIIKFKYFFYNRMLIVDFVVVIIFIFFGVVFGKIGFF